MRHFSYKSKIDLNTLIYRLWCTKQSQIRLIARTPQSTGLGAVRTINEVGDQNSHRQRDNLNLLILFSILPFLFSFFLTLIFLLKQKKARVFHFLLPQLKTKTFFPKFHLSSPDSIFLPKWIMILKITQIESEILHNNNELSFSFKFQEKNNIPILGNGRVY